MTHFTAPWTPEQVANLNAYQRARMMHPFTCGKRIQHPDNPGVLVATEDGWYCPVPYCDYQQRWAHEFMAAGLSADIGEAPDVATDQQQPRPGDRVRVTFEATASFSSDKGLTVILPGDDVYAQRFCVVPAHATVEVLEPPTLAGRMAVLADELEAEPGYGGYGDGLSRAVSRIREELAAHGEARAAQPEVLCPRCGHDGITTNYLAAGDRVAGGMFSRVLRDWLSRRCCRCDHWWQEFPVGAAKEEL